MAKPTLDWNLLHEVKRGFVPMPAGQPQPVAGAGQMTDGLTSPMGGADPAMGGGGGMPMDPAMMGMDPSMMGGGGAPMDPAMMGMDPAAMGGGGGGGGGMPMDPAAMGVDPAAAAAPSQISFTMTVPEFIEFLTAIRGSGDSAVSKKAKSGKADVGSKLDHLISALGIQPPDQGGSDAGIE